MSSDTLSKLLKQRYYMIKSFNLIDNAFVSSDSVSFDSNRFLFWCGDRSSNSPEYQFQSSFCNICGNFILYGFKKNDTKYILCKC